MRWLFLVLLLAGCADPKPHVVYNNIHAGCMKKCVETDSDRRCTQYCNCIAWEGSNIPAAELREMDMAITFGQSPSSYPRLMAMQAQCVRTVTP
jgi:hypothetical protein